MKHAKKLLSLLLTLALCLTLAAPALAAFPEASAEANKKYALTFGEGDSCFKVEEEIQLYDREYNDDDWYNDLIVEGKKWSSYYVISDQTRLTISNTGTGDDYYVALYHVGYVKDTEGRYVMEDDCIYIGCNLRESGNFNTLAFDDTPQSTDPLMKLAAGESYTLPASELTCHRRDGAEPGTVYCLELRQVYPNEGEFGRYWYRRFLVMVDNERAAALQAEADAKKDETPANGVFTDVAADAYYYDAVYWALENNVTTGTTATTFSPDATCTRGQVATFLWRAMGCPEPETTVNPFTDVKESDYFYKAVLWAFENNITTGTTATTFSPNNTCTSAHVITFLWRAAGKPAPTSFTGTEYYAEAAAWAAENNLTQGTAVPFAPANLSTRADIVTYLYRYLSK